MKFVSFRSETILLFTIKTLYVLNKMLNLNSDIHSILFYFSSAIKKKLPKTIF